MKTSKIIFVSMLSTIALLILLAFIDVRLTGKKNVSTTLATFNTVVPDFSVLIIDYCEDIDVLAGTSPSIIVDYEGKVHPDIKFTSKNDTLIISGVRQSNEADELMFVKVQATSSLKKIITKNSSADITLPDLKQLRVEADSSDVSIITDITGKNLFSNLELHGRKHSFFHASGFSTDTTGLLLQNSDASLMIKSGRMHGSITNESDLSILQPAEMSLKSDPTSRININHFFENNVSIREQ